MAKKFLTGLALANLASDPLSGVEGELYYNTTDDVVKIYSNGLWSELTTSASVYYQAEPPQNAELGQFWVDSDSTGSAVLDYNLTSYLTQASASSTYLTQSSGLTAATASATYLTQASASSTYATKIDFPSDAWTSYTPSLRTNGGTITLGNGSVTGAYKQIGKTCFFRARFLVGSTTSIGANEIVIGLPIQASSLDYNFTGSALDNTNAWYEITGVGRYLGSTTEFAMIAKSTGTGSSSQGVTNTTPFSFLDGDYITISGSYEVI